MSAQFGTWNPNGGGIDRGYLDHVKSALDPYGPDGSAVRSINGLAVLYCAFCTTPESRSEKQPHVGDSGVLITWDGRLDNRRDLVELLQRNLTADSSDVAIVAAAYEEWNKKAFAKLLGDWALSIWDPRTRSLILAKDPMGTRHLYYSIDKNRVTWSTVLDPLILFAETTFSLCEEYIAGWFSLFPDTHLTPYIGVRSVPPSSFVLIQKEKHEVSKYWDFDPQKRIRYNSDSEYEEHFRFVFAEAVRRRLRSDRPVLAELSGGMDSSSIVCMADDIIARGDADAPRLDTISYYNDSEPNWNERPYFEKVEARRGRTGSHVNVGLSTPLCLEHLYSRFPVTPNSGIRRRDEISSQAAATKSSDENRVVLSGIGGDEALGGVPTPIPELMDLLARAKFVTLARKLEMWALNERRPWIHLFIDAARGFFPTTLVGVPNDMRPAPWMCADFVKRNRASLTGYPSRVKVGRSLPSFQEGLTTLEGLRRQLHCAALPSDPLREMRYPYLDRELLEFILAVPREQLLRPGQRRSLMRRALAGIVPDEILSRKRKAVVARSLIGNISAACAGWLEDPQLVTSSLGIVDSERFFQALTDARHGKTVQIVTLMRTVGIESWLRRLLAEPTLVDCRQFAGREPGKSRSTEASGQSVVIGRVQLANCANTIHKERR